MKDRIIINPIEEKILRNNIKDYNNIDSIINGEYYNFSFGNLDKISDFNNYKYIISALSLGYTYDEMLKNFSHLIKEEDINNFKKVLNKYDFDENMVKAINRYSFGYEMILLIKQGQDKKYVKSKLKNEFMESMRSFGYSNRLINNLTYHIFSADYSEPLYANYIKINKYLENMNISKKHVYVVKSLLKKLDLYNDIDDTIIALDESLKAPLPNSIITYKTIRKDVLKNVNKDNVISAGNYFSTSLVNKGPLINKNDDNYLLKLYIPKNTCGLLISPFSNEYNNEFEVLLNDSNIYLFSSKGDTYEGLVLSNKINAYDSFIENEKIIFSNNEYINELNRYLVLNSNNGNFDSVFTIENDKVKHSLYSNKDNRKESVLENDISINDLNKYIIEFTKRIPVYSTKPTEKSIILSGNNNIRMIINNIDEKYANEISRLTSMISSDLYYEKQNQLEKNTNPLLYLSIRNIKGNVDITVISIIVLLICFVILTIIVISNIKLLSLNI